MPPVLLSAAALLDSRFEQPTQVLLPLKPVGGSVRLPEWDAFPVLLLQSVGS